MNTINSTQRSTEGQCIELLMQLRRSLTQQYEVRLAVYEVKNLDLLIFIANSFRGIITGSSKKSDSYGTDSRYAHLSSKFSRISFEMSVREFRLHCIMNLLVRNVL